MERVVPWLPLDGLDAELFLSSIWQGSDQRLVVTLESGMSNAFLQVEFEYAKSYQVTTEYLHVSAPWWGMLTMNMYEVLDSTYLRSLSEAAPADFQDMSFRHFMFITATGCVDAISLSPPTAAWLPEPVFEQTANAAAAPNRSA